MKNIIKLGTTAFLACLLFLYSKCGSEGNFPGREYMPDMAHGLAYEANVVDFYHYNTWGTPEEKRAYSMPRIIPAGTIARGHSIYHFADSDTARILATNALTSNPVLLRSKADLEKGRELYNTFCGVCHGDEANGNGVLYNDGNGPYPLAPANLVSDEFKAATEGRFYHAIMYGKNKMGAYKDKLNEQERWLVIHWIRYQQGKGGIKSTVDAKFDSVLTMKAIPAKVDSTGKVLSAAISPSSPEGQTIVLSNVFFESGARNIRAVSFVELDKVASIMNKYPKLRLAVNGHTDNVGAAETNMAISKQRADVVRNYLVNAGVSPKRLEAIGYGSSKPMSGDPAKNRRTDLTILAY